MVLDALNSMLFRNVKGSERGIPVAVYRPMRSERFVPVYVPFGRHRHHSFRLCLSFFSRFRVNVQTDLVRVGKRVNELSPQRNQIPNKILT